jgi:hypothetical protein
LWDWASVERLKYPRVKDYGFWLQAKGLFFFPFLSFLYSKNTLSIWPISLNGSLYLPSKKGTIFPLLPEVFYSA